MNVSKYFNWSFKCDEGLLIFKNLLRFFNQKLDHLNWEVYQRDWFGILLSVKDDVVVKIINHHIDHKIDFVWHIFFGDRGHSFFELLAPLLLHVKGFRFVLLRFKVLVEQCLKLLALWLFSETLLTDRWDKSEIVFRNRVFFLVFISCSGTSCAFHFKFLVMIKFFSL